MPLEPALVESDLSDTVSASVVRDFVPHFAPGARLVYARLTRAQVVYCDEAVFCELGLQPKPHSKMPDLLLWDETRQWLFVVDSLTSRGWINPKRHAQLKALFAGAKLGCVYISACPSRKIMANYIVDPAWETEAWAADEPVHLIHFGGDRFSGPRKMPSQLVKI